MQEFPVSPHPIGSRLRLGVSGLWPLPLSHLTTPISNTVSSMEPAPSTILGCSAGPLPGMRSCFSFRDSVLCFVTFTDERNHMIISMLASHVPDKILKERRTGPGHRACSPPSTGCTPYVGTTPFQGLLFYFLRFVIFNFNF